ncbi:MAG: VWA domain-containing protein [Bacteroidales bacterium]|nr:VWA domain-containing protein [Candidatus Physcousia equi]
MTFANPLYFLLLALLIPYIIWYVIMHRRIDPVMQVSSTEAFRYKHHTWRERLVHAPFVLRILCFVFAIIALARPQSTDEWSEKNVEGIDIMLCMDVSTSMLAEDLKPNRIKAAKEVAVEFINGRPNDNIGLTIFAGEAYTQCPMTTDHAVLLNLLNKMECDMAETGLIEDGTAIGMGIANSVTRLKDSKAKSKVVIMLTDGSNNRGEISPFTAADIAKSFGVRVYTIGVGTNGTARYPMKVAGYTQYVNIPVEIDAKTLGQIAKTTDGVFYRATDNKSLHEVYQEIDKLEKTKMQVNKFNSHSEEFFLYLLIALIALLLDLLLRTTVLNKLP